MKYLSMRGVSRELLYLTSSGRKIRKFQQDEVLAHGCRKDRFLPLGVYWGVLGLGAYWGFFQNKKRLER